MNGITFDYPIDNEFYGKMHRVLIESDYNDFVIITHARPDGDTVGSSFALAHILRLMGKNARAVCHDPIPEKYGYITDVEIPDFTPAYAVTVDVASPALIGEEPTLPVICAIDHHVKNTVDAPEKFIKSNKGACGEIIFEFAVYCGIKFDTYLAKCLYTAIATDTGCLKYEAVNEYTYLASAYLSRFIPRDEAAKINLLHFDTKTLKQIRIESYALENMHTYFGDTVGICVITDEIKEKFGATDEDLECISSLARQIDTVESSFSIKQKENGICKISLRTKEYVDAALFCSHFGGGGHVRAAGCTIEGTPAEAEQKIIEMYRKTIIQR